MRWVGGRVDWRWCCRWGRCCTHPAWATRSRLPCRTHLPPADEAWEGEGGGKFSFKIDKSGARAREGGREMQPPSWAARQVLGAAAPRPSPLPAPPLARPQPSPPTCVPRAGVTRAPSPPPSCARTPTLTFIATWRPTSSRRARAQGGVGGGVGAAARSRRCKQCTPASLPQRIPMSLQHQPCVPPVPPPPPPRPPPPPPPQGEWTPEEHELFLRTARAHGAGDKWGLFASHIPQRVGYQCSAYYRRVCACVCVWGGEKLGMCAWHAVWQGGARRVVARAWGVLRPLALVYTPLPPTLDTRAIPMHACREVIIPAGLVLDPRYRMTRGGKAVYASNA